MDVHNPYQAPGAGGTSMGVQQSHDGISPVALSHLGETRPWVKISGVLCLISAAFLVLASVLFMVGVSEGAGVPRFMGLIYLPIAGLSVVPGIFLMRYASGINALLNGGGQHALEEALGAQKSYWKFVGVLALIMIALYGLGFLMMMVGLVLG